MSPVAAAGLWVLAGAALGWSAAWWAQSRARRDMAALRTAKSALERELEVSTALGQQLTAELMRLRAELAGERHLRVVVREPQRCPERQPPETGAEARVDGDPR